MASSIFNEQGLNPELIEVALGGTKAISVWHFITIAGSAFRQSNVATMPALTVRANQPFFWRLHKARRG